MAISKLQQQYRGCLLGALIGDCLGSRFENESFTSDLLKQHIDQAENGEGEFIILTDDTQMTQELAKSLIEKKSLDHSHLAQCFTERYYKDGRTAGYGAAVRLVFKKLRDSKYSNPLQPASEQFEGAGSYGNGAAMRVSPVPLFAFPDLQRTAELADQSASITHSHVHGRHGAIFLALAIRRCLLTSDIQDTESYLSLFKEDLHHANVCQEFTQVVEVIQMLLAKDKVSDTQVEILLGTGIAAIKSVPTALFCFLRSLKPIPEVETDNPVRRTVEYAISLGGDTDTIASMAGALAGAYYGQRVINTNIIQACPDSDLAVQLADSLYDFLQAK